MPERREFAHKAAARQAADSRKLRAQAQTKSGVPEKDAALQKVYEVLLIRYVLPEQPLAPRLKITLIAFSTSHSPR
jgi:hypothetical protein